METLIVDSLGNITTREEYQQKLEIFKRQRNGQLSLFEESNGQKSLFDEDFDQDYFDEQDDYDDNCFDEDDDYPYSPGLRLFERF